MFKMFRKLRSQKNKKIILKNVAQFYSSFFKIEPIVAGDFL